MYAAQLAMNLASIAPAMAAGAAQFFAQSGWGGFAGVAAMAAVVAGFGVAVGSGGASGPGQSAADAQKAQGTGSVFGDANAKSASIARAIDLTSANSSIELTHTAGMLASLRNIEHSMTGLTNLIARTTGLTDGTGFGVQTGQINKGAATDSISGIATGITKALFGPGLGDKISSFINNIWGKTTQNIVDAGLQFGGSVRDLQAGKGYDQYASVDTTKSSFFGLSKSTSNSVQTQGASAEISSQFGLIFTNLEGALKAASVAVGGTAEDVSKALDSLTIDMSKVSLKGLTGTALTDALNGVLSKAMDQMAQAAMPEMDAFRKVGEGYAETVIRVATDYANLDSILQSSGMTFGAVGVKSIAARENLIDLAGGIDKLADRSNFFNENFLTQAQRLAPVEAYVTQAMSDLGLASIDTRKKFADLVLGIKVADPAGQQLYVTLMGLEEAFAKTHAATVDLSKSEQQIADERKSLQDQLDLLTMTSAQLLTKQRDALDASNQALFDQIQALSTQQAINKEQHSLDIQLMTAMGNAEGALAATRSDSLAALLSDQARLTQQQIWAAEASAAAISKAQASSAAVYAGFGSAMQSTIDKITKATQALKDFSAQINTGDMSPLSGSDQYVATKAALRGVTQDNAQGAVTAFLKSAQAHDVSKADYSRDVAYAQSILAAIIGSSSARVSSTVSGYQGIYAALAAAGIGAHANGGVASGVSLVGEQGPELVDFARPARVYTASQSRQMMGGGNSDELKAEMKLMREQMSELLGQVVAQTKRGADGSTLAGNALADAQNGRPLAIKAKATV